MVVRPPRPTFSGRPRLLAPVLVIVAVLVVLIAVGIGLYTDLLWFRSVDYSGVFTTVLRTRVLLFLGFGVLMAVIVGVNIAVAYRARPPFRPMSLEQQNLERYRVAIEPFQRLALIGVASLLGLFAGLSAASRWQTWLLWRNRTDFGVKDPQFGRDVGYYAFSYPFYRFVLGFLLAAVVLALIASAATHYLYGGLRLQTQGEKVSPGARAHLSVLLGVFVLLKALAYYLDRFGLVFANRGFVQGGAAYTDVNAVLPAKNILIGVAVICALLFFANVAVRNVLLPGGALALLVLAAVVLGGVLPAYTQQFRVKPNERDRELPYISRNIEGTRAAYGISDVELQQYGADPPSANQAISLQDPPNARLLDPNYLSDTYQQLQRLRQYFGVTGALDVDRYTVAGKAQDYVVAAREIDLNGLASNQRNWVNERLTYTHGNGLIAARADKVDPDGQPLFTNPGLGAGSSAAIKIDQPRIYYGESAPEYSVVNTKIPEIDGPSSAAQADVSDNQATSSYAGKGGVQLSNVVRKTAYALKFREPNLLLSGSITDQSRLMYIRSPRDRVAKVAPFLELDGDPYPAAVDGRIVWIVDGYTTSANYPYSQRVPFGEITQDSQTGRVQPQEDVNYIRNSVKATVDAYSGKVTLYKFGPTDPVVETWDKAFGGILKPFSAMSPDLKAHLRYPEDLFKVQRQLLAQYHVTDPKVFFSREDQWEIPTDPAEALNSQFAQSSGQTPVPGTPAQLQTNTGGPAQPPYYSLLKFPGDSGSQFRLSTSFTFSGRPNLAAFASVSSDPDTYGKIQLLQLPSNAQTDGPGQVANRFLTDRTVAGELFAFRRNNAEVKFGNLLTLPIGGGGLIYVQPVYVQAQGTTGFPTLQQVLVAYGTRVAAAPSLEGALTNLLGQGGTPPPTTTPPTTPPTEGPSASPSPSTSVPPPSGDVAALISQADTAYKAGQAALQAGNFAEFGVQQERLKAALGQLVALQGGSTPPSTPPSPTPGATPTPSVEPSPSPS